MLLRTAIYYTKTQTGCKGILPLPTKELHTSTYDARSPPTMPVAGYETLLLHEVLEARGA